MTGYSTVGRYGISPFSGVMGLMISSSGFSLTLHRVASNSIYTQTITFLRHRPKAEGMVSHSTAISTFPISRYIPRSQQPICLVIKPLSPNETTKRVSFFGDSRNGGSTTSWLV